MSYMSSFNQALIQGPNAFMQMLQNMQSGSSQSSKCDVDMISYPNNYYCRELVCFETFMIILTNVF
jgi:hypothetical protein